MRILMSVFLIAVFTTFSIAANQVEIASKLQDVSITLKAGSSQGSGVIVTRELKENKDSSETQKINFVLTAGHVVDGLRNTREIINKDGDTKKLIEFKDASIVKELIDNARRVGEIEMDCRVLRYSDADNGEDLALLMVLKRDFVDVSTEFYLEKESVPPGTNILHCGSLLGQIGQNSITGGVISQVGRTLDIGTGRSKPFDQIDCAGFPGSSGGGIFLNNNTDNNGKYVGMLVRGMNGSDSFNFMVPIRRIRDWAKEVNIEWVLDNNLEKPTLEELLKQPIEGNSISGSKDSQTNSKNNLKTLINSIK